MGKSANRLVYLAIMVALLWSTVIPVGMAKENDSFVKEAWAWVENGELRFQAKFQKSDEGELAVWQDGRAQKRTIEHDSRVSVGIKAATNSQMMIKLQTERNSELWKLSIPEGSVQGEGALEVREAAWDKAAAKKSEQVELISIDEEETAEALPEAQDEEAAPTDEEESQLELEDWAIDFYQEFAGDDKPKEASLRARAVVFELEPNDTFSKADWLFDKKDAHGKIGKSGDVDVWKIKAAQDGSLNIALRDIPFDRDYQLYVFDQDKQEVGRSEKEGKEDESIEGIAVAKNEWYYVMVKGNRDSDFHTQFYYRLRADFLAEQRNAALDEYEPNDLMADAHSVDTGTSIKGSLHNKEDVDFYSFSFTLASTIFLDLKEMPQGMDMDLYLMDETEKVLAKSEKPKNADEQIVFNADPGKYYVKVQASKQSGFSANSYQLSIGIRTIPVILIPGIGGSRLEVEENGKISEIWLGLGDSLIGINDPKHRRLLALEPIKAGSVDVKPREKGISIFPEREDEGFRAIEYLSYAPIPAVQNMTEQYSSMVKELHKIGYQKFRNLYAMPYDWRYSNSKNAAALKEKIDLALERSGARQVQLVAHSMGGLLVRETLLANVSYQPKVHRIIYMGTPFLGSPRAYQAIRFGYNFSIPWMDEETGKIISEYAPAVYELLPAQKYAQTAPFLKKDQENPYSYNEFLQDKAVRLDYSPLVKQAGKLHEKWESKTIPVPQYSIIGQGQSTLMGYTFDRYHDKWVPFYDNSIGDGTVPFVSASYAQKDISKRFYVTGEHAKLPTIPEVIRQVVELLKGIEELQPGVRQSASKKPKFLYYMLSREDGAFPEVTLVKSGRAMTLQREKKEVWEDLNIEYHGNIVVVHVRDLEPLTFQNTGTGRIMVKEFSSEHTRREEQEEGKRYWLEQDVLTEQTEADHESAQRKE